MRVSQSSMTANKGAPAALMRVYSPSQEFGEPYRPLLSYLDILLRELIYCFFIDVYFHRAAERREYLNAGHERLDIAPITGLKKHGSKRKRVVSRPRLDLLGVDVREAQALPEASSSYSTFPMVPPSTAISPRHAPITSSGPKFKRGV